MLQHERLTVQPSAAMAWLMCTSPVGRRRQGKGIGVFREIELSQGRVAKVSPEDFDRVSAFKWTTTCNSRWGQRDKLYAHRKTSRADGPRRTVYLHRFIMDPPAGMVVDHINGDGLDCRRENLRVVSQSENTDHCRFRKRRAVECYL